MIELTEGSATENLQFNKVFIEDLVIHQEFNSTNVEDPRYYADIKYFLYAVASSGTLHRDPSGITSIRVDDIYALATSQALAGDTQLSLLMSDMSSIVAKLLTENTNLSAVAL